LAAGEEGGVAEVGTGTDDETAVVVVRWLAPGPAVTCAGFGPENVPEASMTAITAAVASAVPASHGHRRLHAGAVVGIATREAG
jgi:hypothetical protein